MASKIKGQTMYLPIKPYTLSEGTGLEYNELAVRPDYDDRHKYFYVSIHAGWSTGFGHGCVIMGDNNPLSAPQYVKVKDAPKNSQKMLDQMYQNLEAGKEAIAWLFDHREWQKLNAAVRNIAMNGYLESFRKQMEDLINSTNNNINNQNSEVMENKTNNNQESVNAAQQQVNNNKSEAVVKQVDVIGLMNGLKTNGTAKLSDYATPIEDAQAEEVENVAVGEATLDSIMPSMSAPVEEPEAPTKQEVAQAISKAANEGTATTMPLGQHGTLVIGGVPKPTEKPKVTLRTKTPQTEPDPEAVGELAGMLTRVRLFEYTTSHNEKALGIAGFSGEDDPRWKPIRDERRRLAAEYKNAKAKDPKAKAKSHPIYLSRMMDPATGGWCNTMLLGPRYMDVAKQLCEAYNTTDRNLWKQAEQAVKDCKTAISNGFQTERTARRAARKAEREAQNTQPSAVSPQPLQGKTYTAAEMEALVRAMAQAMATAQGADVKDFEPLVQAAMKKAA